MSIESIIMTTTLPSNINNYRLALASACSSTNETLETGKSITYFLAATPLIIPFGWFLPRDFSLAAYDLDSRRSVDSAYADLKRLKPMRDRALGELVNQTISPDLLSLLDSVDSRQRRYYIAASCAIVFLSAFNLSDKVQTGA